MTIHCKVCAVPFTSLNVDRAAATGEVMGMLTQHALEKHPKKLNCGCMTPCKHKTLNKDMQELTLVATQYMLVDRLAKVGDDETFFNENTKKMEMRIMQLLGFDAEQVDENENLIEMPPSKGVS